MSDKKVVLKEFNRTGYDNVFPVVSNPNLLDNWYFKSPINQRGQTTYTAAGFCIDRWYKTSNDASPVYVTENGLYANTSTGPNIRQKSGDYYQLVGKTLTASILFGDGRLLTCTHVFESGYRFSYDTNSGGPDELVYKTTTNAPEIFNFRVNSGTYVVAVKLEEGTVSTLLSDTKPNHSDELAKCLNASVDSDDKYSNLKLYGNRFDTNVIASKAQDIPNNWSALGAGYGFYDAENLLNDQPSRWGIIVSWSYRGDVFQIWRTQSPGPTYQRSGNGTGWATTWQVIPVINMSTSDPGAGFAIDTGCLYLVYE